MYDTVTKRPEISMEYLLATFQSHWKFITIVFLALFIPMAIVALSQPTLYTATAKVLFENARRINLEMSAQLSAREVVRVIPVEKLNSQAEIITGSPLLLELIGTLGLAQTPEEEQKQLRKLRQGINAQVVPASSIIVISYTSEDSDLARRIVNTLAELFTNYYTGEVQGEDDPLAFYQQLYDRVDQTVRTNTEQLNNIRRELGIHTSFTSEYGALAERADALQTRLVDIDLSLEEDRAKAAVLLRGLDREPARVSSAVDMVSNPARMAIERELNALISEKEELLIRYTPENPVVKRKIREIESLRSRLETIPDKVVGRSVMMGNPRHEGLKRELTEVRASIAQLSSIRSSLADELKETQSRIDKLQKRQYEVVALEDTIDADEKHRRQYNDKLSDAQFIDSMHRQHIRSVNVVEKARTPVAKSKRVEGVALSFVLSLLLGFGLAMLRDWLRPVVKSAEELKELMKAPVLATLPDYAKESASLLPDSAPDGSVRSR